MGIVRWIVAGMTLVTLTGDQLPATAGNLFHGGT